MDLIKQLVVELSAIDIKLLYTYYALHLICIKKYQSTLELLELKILNFTSKSAWSTRYASLLAMHLR